MTKRSSNRRARDIAINFASPPVLSANGSATLSEFGKSCHTIDFAT